MKLFMFYHDFCRCYLIAETIEKVHEQKENLFREYMEDDNPWIDLDENDPEDLCFIEDKRKDFYKSVEKAREIPQGFKFDSHY